MAFSKDSIVTIGLAVLLGILLRSAPGHPAWEFDNKSVGVNGNNDENVIRFLGGDGKTGLTGKLYHPQTKNTNTKPPIIVLAHGLGLSQDCHLDPFVKAFTKAGFAAFTFDYATFGASDGYPRHVVHQTNHIADLHAAIQKMRTDEKVNEVVDVTKIGLWGTSLGGGHVLEVAAMGDNNNGRRRSNDDDGSSPPQIGAVVAQVPALVSGLESVLGTIQRSPVVGTKGLVNVLYGLLKAASKRILGQTWYLPLHGLPGSAALMQNPGDDEGYSSLLPPNGGRYNWKNAASAGSVLRLLTHRPMNQVSQIQTTPTLLIAAENDTLCPAKEIQKAANLIGNSELLVLPNAGHFDVYHTDVFDKVISTTIEFFQKHL